MIRNGFLPGQPGGKKTGEREKTDLIFNTLSPPATIFFNHQPEITLPLTMIYVKILINNGKYHLQNQMDHAK